MKDARSELVRIDASGTAHPIGVTASQRMRAREGAFRLLPSPRHVVLMRLTGEDGKRDGEDGAIVRLAGEITASGDVTDVLAMVAQANWRGELVVLDTEHTRSMFFEQGNIVGVQTTCDEERLGSVLYRFGAITAEQRATIVARMNEGARFGEAASQAGLVSSEKLYTYMGKQIEEVVFATLTVGDGTFFFLDGFDTSRLMSQHMVSAGALLMDAVTRIDEMNYFKQKIPTTDYVPVKVDNPTPPNEELKDTLAGVDGRRSVEEIGRKTGKGEFVTAKQVYSLVQSKHVVMHPPRAEGGPAGLVSAANSALLVIHRSADRAGKGPALRESLASFAVGAGVYDILFRGAGPNPEGVLEPKAVAENSVLVASGSDPENMLKQMLHEYVSFALFSAGTALGSEKENELKREVGTVLGKLRPQG